MSAFSLCLCCTMQASALRRADSPSKGSYQLSVRFVVFRVVLKWEQARQRKRRKKKKKEENNLSQLP
jgi:hypothetical protein